MSNDKGANYFLLAGLGNPGKQYHNTPHNIGFHFLDFLRTDWDLTDFQKKFNGSYLETTLFGHKLILLKPLTFMNLSGNSVKPVVQQKNILPSNIIIFHDEVDLEPGEWNFKSGGGHRGHNGLRHIISSLGTNDFLRFRIGVGRPGHPDLADYLLSNLSREAYQKIIEIFPEIQGKLVDLIQLPDKADS